MADSTLTLSESTDTIRNLIGDPDGDGLTDEQIRRIYNMTYQGYHGQYIHNQVAELVDSGNSAPKTAASNPYVKIFFQPSTTIRSILRVETFGGPGGFTRVPIEKAEKADIMNRLKRSYDNNDQPYLPTAWYAEKAYGDGDEYNAWHFWFHPIPDGQVTFYPFGEASPVDLTGVSPFERPKGVTSGESVAIAHMAAYHCAMLLNKRDRMQQIVELIPEVQRTRFNLRDISLRPKVRPDEAYI